MAEYTNPFRNESPVENSEETTVEKTKTSEYKNPFSSKTQEPEIPSEALTTKTSPSLVDRIKEIPKALTSDLEFQSKIPPSVDIAGRIMAPTIYPLVKNYNTHLAMLQIPSLPFERVESAVANPMLQTQAGRFDMPTLARASWRGLKGEEAGEVGDLYREAAKAMGAPEWAQEASGVVGGLATVGALTAGIGKGTKVPESSLFEKAATKAVQESEIVQKGTQIAEAIEGGSIRLGKPANPNRASELTNTVQQWQKSLLKTHADLYEKYRNHLVARQFIVPAENQLREMGNSGNSLANVLTGIRNRSADLSGAALSDLDPLLASMTKEELANVRPFINGKTKAVSEKVTLFKDLFNEHKQRFYDEAQRLDVKVIDPSTGIRRPIGYNPDFPEFFSKEYFSDSNKEKILKNLIKTGRAKTYADAVKSLDNFQTHVRRFGSLERPKMVGLEGDIDDVRHITNQFFRGESRRLAEIQAFGQENEGVNGFLNAIKDEGGNFNQAKDITDRYLRLLRDDEEISAVLQKTMDFTAMWKLSKAGLSQFGDRIRLLSDTDIPTVLRAGRMATTKEGTAFAIRALGESPTTSRPLLESLSKGKWTDAILNKFYRIGPVDFKGRVIAANTGRLEAKNLFNLLQKRPDNSLIKMRLERFGIDTEAALKRGGLQDRDYVSAARYKDRILQRRDRVLDFPLIFSSNNPSAKLITQFKQPNYDVSRFMFDEWNRVTDLMKQPGGRVEAAKRVARLMTGLTTVGAPIATAKSALSGSLERKGVKGIAADTASNALGLISDLAESGRYAGGPMSFLTGPTVGSWSEAIQVLNQSISGNPRAMARYALKQIPFVGGAISKNVVPPQKRGRKPTQYFK